MQLFKKTFIAVLMLSAVAIITACSSDDPDEDDNGTQSGGDEGTTLVIHYYRFDDDYSHFDSVWLWPSSPESGAGNAYDFDDEDDFGVKQSINLGETNLAESDEIGIIVFTGDWDASGDKDVGEDRVIDVSNPDDDGEVHVYLVQGDTTIYHSADSADVSNQILASSFNDETTIGFQTTMDVTAEDVSLYADDASVSFSNFALEDGMGSLTIDEEVDLTKRYSLEIVFAVDDSDVFTVGFDGIYDSEMFNEAYGYEGELGTLYTEQSTEFRLWAPISDEVTLNLYDKGHDANITDDDGVDGVDDPYETHTLTLQEKGMWSTTVDGDLDGTYYTYTITNGERTHEVVDPYAYSAGVNGERGMVINMDRHAPEGWENDTRPDTIDSATDSIIYELHVRDLTSHETWNGTEDWRGKFLGLTEQGTTHNELSTGLDHILELGVTHVQLLPFFDHGIIDETRHNDPSYEGQHDGIFNWGYMPEHFNVLEGSYATDPYNGEVRVEEFREVVQTFHDNDLRLVMDVVYNHTGKSADSNFDKILPGYYFRMNEDGTFSNGSGTGNETASERKMFRKFMIDSLEFWVEEYNIDGFRFDLMKLHDVDTMNAITDALHEIDDSIIVFGEPWDAGGSNLPEEESAYHGTLDQMPEIGAFNDVTRDGIKGSVFNAGSPGFVQGTDTLTTSVMLGIAGGIDHPGTYRSPLALNPNQTINYVTAHDNNTLHDKLQLSSDVSMDMIEKMQRQSNGIVLSSQGVSFLHAGVEMMRTKPCVVPDSGENTCDDASLYDHNSYRSPDSVNQIDWNWKSDYQDTFEYYRDMIALRRMKDIFTLDTAAQINDQLSFGPNKPGLVSYMLTDENDDWKSTLVLHNNATDTREVELKGDSTWHVVATSDVVGTITDSGVNPLDTFQGGETITLDRNDSYILYSTNAYENAKDALK